MQIKRVELKNYRSHSKIEVEFSRGINLILGKNGRGKSSILEAIGLALFHITDRTGKITGKTFIKYGEKECSILVEFIANDGREYSIFHQYFEKKGKNILLKDLSTEEEYREEIDEKLELLCGIKAEYRNIYENVIIAKQNDFINIFKESPENRAKIFNKIFHTEIYAKLFSDLKSVSEEYVKEQNRLETEKTILLSHMGNKEEILSNYQEEKNTFQIWKEEKEKEFQKKRKIQEDLEKYENLQKEYDKISSLDSLQRDKIQQNTKELKQTLMKAKMARKARFLLKQHQDFYYDYLNLEIKIQEKKKQHRVLQEIREQNQKLSIENEKLEFLIDKNQKEEESLQKETIEQKQLILELHQRIEEERKKKQEITFTLLELKKTNEKIETSLYRKEEREKEVFLLEKQLSAQEKDWKRKEKELLNLDILHIHSSLEMIQEDKISLQGKKEKIAIYQQNIEDYLIAEEKLQQKICPLLKENCENLKNREVNLYFCKEIEKTKTEIQKVLKEIGGLEEQIKQENMYRKQEAAYTVLKEEIENLEKSVLSNNALQKELQLNLEQEKHFLEKTLLLSKFDTVEELQQKIRILEDELLVLDVEKMEKEEEKLKKNVLLLENKEKNLKKERNDFLEKRKENISKIQEEKEELWRELSGEIEHLEKKRSQLQISYNIYLENKKLSDSLEEEKGKIYSLWLKKKENRDIHKKLTIQKRNLEETLETVNYSSIKEQLLKLDELLLTINKKLGESGQKIKNYEEDIQNLRKQEERIQEISKKKSKIERKWKKTENIRKNIKQMGTEVSKNMLDHISAGASINFHKITGRSEKIYWSNEEKDKYQVYLLGKDRKIEYHLLSGGEQVSVAIAIRGSMTQYFSNTKFMILDEPTNNLDFEKRKLLAEYIGEILNHLEQSIIVTHDDTFREMAERIIEL